MAVIVPYSRMGLPIPRVLTPGAALPSDLPRVLRDYLEGKDTVFAQVHEARMALPVQVRRLFDDRVRVIANAQISAAKVAAKNDPSLWKALQEQIQAAREKYKNAGLLKTGGFGPTADAARQEHRKKADDQFWRNVKAGAAAAAAVLVLGAVLRGKR